MVINIGVSYLINSIKDLSSVSKYLFDIIIPVDVLVPAVRDDLLQDLSAALDQAVPSRVGVVHLPDDVLRRIESMNQIINEYQSKV